jgi:hypothetical protein
MNATQPPIATAVKPAKAAKPTLVLFKNAADVVDLLATVNGRAVKHAYTTYAQIAAIATEAEVKLDSLKLPLSLRTGAEWVQTSGAEVSSSYKNVRQGTRVTLTRRTGGWTLKANPANVYTKGGGKGKLSLTQDQLDAAAERLLAGINVLAA